MKTHYLLFCLLFSGRLISFSQVNNDIRIGSQLWMKNNLAVDRFSNGDPISFAEDEESWRQFGEQKKPCYTLLKTTNGELVVPHVYLYNWYVAADPRGVAPNGYRVPNASDIMELIANCGGVCETAQKLKSKEGWDKNELINAGETTKNGSDAFGMNLAPMHHVLPSGMQNNCYLHSGFWTVTDAPKGIEMKDLVTEQLNYKYVDHVARCFSLTFNDCMNYLHLFFKEGGMPIRCIRKLSMEEGEVKPIAMFSNTPENFALEKAQHLDILCPSCVIVSSELVEKDTLYLLKETYSTSKDNGRSIFYFDQSTLQKKSSAAGIGVRLAEENGQILIKEVVKGGACEKSNRIHEKDVIVGVQLENKFVEFSHLGLNEATKLIRGVEGSKVMLKVFSSKDSTTALVELIRAKMPNWDLQNLLEKAHYQSYFPTMIDNYYFYHKYKELPESHKYSEKNRYIYILTKASRLFYAGADNYRLDDFLQLPKPEWDENELLSGAYQLAVLYKGGSQVNPIRLKSITDGTNLLLTFHFKPVSAGTLSEGIQQINFEHLKDKSAITLFFKLEN
jgi:uncharacterized protein (TIGR02145 family)